MRGVRASILVEREIVRVLGNHTSAERA
jgi:hypothetical protein